MGPTPFPIVTLLLVVRNEKHSVQAAIRSFSSQNYPKDSLEIIFVDGCSTDGTREYLEQCTTELSLAGWKVTLLENQKKILATGWNIGITAANGQFVCRIDAHSVLDSDYISHGINRLLENSTIVCVGGVMQSMGSGIIGHLLADFTSCPFGMGGASFRTGVNELCETDTSVFGIYRRSALLEAGLFNENLARNQDIDLHDRLKKMGWKFLTDPSMRVTYYVRDNLKSIYQKAFSDGYWITYGSTRYLRHVIPLLFFMYSIVLLFFSFFTSLRDLKRRALFLPVQFYIILSLYFGLTTGKGYTRVILPIFFPFYHLSYGFGSFFGVLDKLKYFIKYFLQYFNKEIGAEPKPVNKYL